MPNKNDRLKVEAAMMLAQAKTLYRRIYPKQPFTSKDELTEIVFEIEPRHILTSKEKAVLKQIAQGMLTKEIAADLQVSVNTIETHRKNMFSKFSVGNVAELIEKTSKLYWL